MEDSSEEMVREHQEVITALERGDIDGIRETIARQIVASRDRILKAILQGDFQSIQVNR